MKKKYISPELLLVELRCSQMLAESVELFNDPEITTTGLDGGWVKEESNLSSKSLWDNEW